MNSMNAKDAIKHLTHEVDEALRHEAQMKQQNAELPQTQFLGNTPFAWQVRLELSFDPRVTFDLTVDGDVTIGRETDHDILSIFPTIDGSELGISRKHIMLRPTVSVLYLMDLGSTNGTRLNTHLLGANIPYPLMNGDMISIGRLEFIVRIIQMPQFYAGHEAGGDRDPEAIMPFIIRAITSQLDLKDVIKQSIDMTRLYTAADEVSIWLVDEMSGELFLEAGHGMKEQKVFHLPVENSLAGRAIKQRKPQRTNRRLDEDPIKLKTGYIAEGVIYVPLTLGEMQVGVISAVHHEPGKAFTDLDERIMVGIAELTAISIQNARLFQSTRQDLTRRSKVVSALQYALTQDFKRQLHSVVGYSTLLRNDDSLREETVEMLDNIAYAGENMLEMIERLLNMARLSLEPITKRAPCDLVEIVGNVMDSMRELAETKAIRIRGHVDGKPYRIKGDAQYLFYSMYSLLDNAITYTPEEGEIDLGLYFTPEGISIQVRDTGPGIPEDELLDLFDRFFHRKPTDGSLGLGVGLEIVRKTVEAHAGTITAQNLPKGGAEFTINLPVSIRVDWPVRTGSLK